MKPVIQLEPTGCGIASVAAITGQTYAQAKAMAHRLGIAASDPALWSDTVPVRRMLRQCGMRTADGERPFRDWDTLPDLALLAIKWHYEKGVPFWHWVVFVREPDAAYVLDSRRALRIHRRADFGRIKPKWYIAVTPI